MTPGELTRGLANPKADKPALAQRVVAQPTLLAGLFEGLAHPMARIRFGSARVLEFVARRSPATLYPRFDFFVVLLDHPNHILQWEAIRILAHLVAVDAERRFDRIFRRFFAPIRGPVMITAANVIRSASVIAHARPEWADRIARRILEVEKAQYQTAECRNVALGHALEALAACWPLLKQPASALAFVRRQTRNRRASTRKRAVALLARWERPRRGG